MAQVLTNENMVEFIQTRQVPEFKAPEKSEGASVAGGVATEPSKEGSAPAADASKDAPRDLTTGKFVKADGEKAPKEEQAAPAADDDDHDDDGAKLSDAVKRKIDKIVAKKHRAMKEAEEFGREEYSARRAAEQRAVELQREIEELKKSGTGPAPAKDSGSDPDEPKPEDFKTVGEYTRALTKYEVDKAAKKAGEASKKQSEQEKQQAQADERAAAFAQRQEKFISATPDYLSVVGSADFDFPAVGMQYMVESEYGPQLAYHFAQNPKDADRLRTLSPGRLCAELGKLEAKFEKQPDPAKPAAAATPSVSRAPAPITPLEGKTTPVEKDPAKMSFRELREYRMAERAAGKR